MQQQQEQQEQKIEREQENARKLHDEIKDYEDSILDLVTYFESHAQSDPFYEEKKASKLRQLKYYCDRLPKESHKIYQDAKWKGMKIINGHGVSQDK